MNGLGIWSRGICFVLTVVLLGADPVRAEEPSLTTAQAADQAVAAFDANDAAALAALAEADAPDPWFVADALCFRGRIDVATAFAEAAPRPATKAIPAYIASRKDADREEDARSALARAVNAMRSDLGAALAAIEEIEAPGDTVIGIALRARHGVILGQSGRAQEAYPILDACAAAARKIGWVRYAEHMYGTTGFAAFSLRDYDGAVRAWTAALELAEALEDDDRIRSSLEGLGDAELRRGNPDAAVALQTRAVEVSERIGDAMATTNALRSLAFVLSRAGRYTDVVEARTRAVELAASTGDKVLHATILSELGVAHRYAGNLAESLETQEHALEMFETLGHKQGIANALGRLGTVHTSFGNFAESLASHQRALTLMEELGDQSGIARTLGNIANAHSGLGNFAEAQEFDERSLALMEKRGDRTGVARTTGNLALTLKNQGDLLGALELQERAKSLWEALGNRARFAGTLLGLGSIYMALGDPTKALKHYEQARKIQRQLNDRVGLSRTLGNMGNAHSRLGRYAKSLTFHQRALGLKQDIGDRASIARTLGNIGNVHLALGDYAEALAFGARALAEKEAIGDRAGQSATLLNIGNVYMMIGNIERSLSYDERALAIREEIGDRAGAARAQKSAGTKHTILGNFETAAELLSRALETLTSIGAVHSIAHAQESLGGLHYEMKDAKQALEHLELALSLYEQVKDHGSIASTLTNIGVARIQLGDTEQGMKDLDRAIRLARRVRQASNLVAALQNVSVALLEQDDPAGALSRAREALGVLEQILGGLSEEEGARAREENSRVFEVGTLAAIRLDDLPEALTFVESGRAGALLESLGGRQALEWTDVPEALHELEAEARAAEARARHEYERVLAGGKRKETRAKAKALDEATDRVREVVARIQREAKRAAGLFYPRAATIEEVQDALQPDQALVLYAICLDEAYALVIGPDDARAVRLGDKETIESACESLDVTAADIDPTAALDRLDTLLVKPLALDESVKEVLVSPEGPLCYVPFGAIFDRPVALTPSGTTHMLLADDLDGGGEGVLALGDPDYAGVSEGATAIYHRGKKLVRLHGTRKEAETVGDRVLLGADASESGLAQALAERPRWRAVHFACHGLVDPERPTLSSLALSRAGDDDGFLTAAELLRAQVPADLAVLSACETGKGQVVKGEGIVGLTRAFMYAGAPRVLCSLWKVDDKATQALMIKFYELWNPKEGQGIDAAAALREAQAHVQTHEKWKHPYYWAAWVLWGLPD